MSHSQIVQLALECGFDEFADCEVMEDNSLKEVDTVFMGDTASLVQFADLLVKGEIMSRIYLVKDDNFGRFLVRANTPQQAVGIVAKEQYEVKVASQDELVALVSDGVKVIEQAKEQE
jgi:hypothetical protein